MVSTPVSTVNVTAVAFGFARLFSLTSPISSAVKSLESALFTTAAVVAVAVRILPVASEAAVQGTAVVCPRRALVAL